MRRPFSRDLRFTNVDHLGERRDLEPPVEGRAALGQRLHRAQLLDLGEREVGGEEAGLGHAVEHDRALARGELRQVLHVGGVDQVRLVARDQVAVLGGHEVGLDVVGAQLDAQRVGLERVLGQVAAGAAAVADDQRATLRAVVAVVVAERQTGRRRQRASQHAGTQPVGDLHGSSPVGCGPVNAPDSRQPP